MNVYSSIFIIAKKWKQYKLLLNDELKNVIYPNNGIKLNHIKEQSTNTFYNKDEP